VKEGLAMEMNRWVLCCGCGFWFTGRFITVDCNHVNFEIVSAEVNTTVEPTRFTGSCE